MKRILIISLAIVVAVSILSAIFYINAKNTQCIVTTRPDDCLPKDKCVAPNDAIVDCEKLRQNPTKTNWFGNE